MGTSHSPSPSASSRLWQPCVQPCVRTCPKVAPSSPSCCVKAFVQPCARSCPRSCPRIAEISRETCCILIYLILILVFYIFVYVYTIYTLYCTRYRVVLPYIPVPVILFSLHCTGMYSICYTNTYMCIMCLHFFLEILN